MPASRRPTRSFLFTKNYLPHVWLKRKIYPAGADALIHYGIPSPRLCGLLRTHVRSTRLPLRYVGDLDPLDLTVFVALKAGGGRLAGRRGGSVPVLYFGIDDEWLALCERNIKVTGPSRAGPLRRVVIPMAQVERRQLLALERAGLVLDALVGVRCAALLRSGFKLEIEGATNPALYRPRHHPEVLSMLTRPARRRRA